VVAEQYGLRAAMAVAVAVPVMSLALLRRLTLHGAAEAAVRQLPLWLMTL